jgi:hypothetical protein
MGRKRLTSEQQIAGFWRRVDGGDFETCWLWTGPGDRYGACSYQGGTVSTHRFAYELMVGEIPEGLQLDHLCRNTKCVNPWHLEPVTSSVNLKRSSLGQVNKARGAAQTHCVNSHEFAGKNLYVTPSGRRSCRQCDRDRGAKYRDRKRTQVYRRTA